MFRDFFRRGHVFEAINDYVGCRIEDCLDISFSEAYELGDLVSGS